MFPTLAAIPQKARHPDRVIRTTYMDERELLNDLLWLHNGGAGVDADICYSIRRFWQGLPAPRFKFDYRPQAAGVCCADAQCLPLATGSLKSIMFDPPFSISGPQKGHMADRFSRFLNYPDLKRMYAASITESARTLQRSGILIVKCQDLVASSKQRWVHIDVINFAAAAGLVLKDLFILINERVILASHIQQQEHARKTHCYYLVFRKVL